MNDDWPQHEGPELPDDTTAEEYEAAQQFYARNDE
jgi:hypothetical protein